MNIVIITDALTEPLYTPRIRFLNRHLIAAGHNVTWFAEQSPSDIPDDLRPANLIEIPYYHSSTDRTLKAPFIFLCDHKNRFFERKIKLTEKPDIIFVSTFLTFGLRAGLHLSRKYKCPLHVDLRDIAEQTPANSYSRSFLSASRLYRTININRRNKILRKATTLTTVSRFHQKLLSRINPNTHLIYNGYDANMFKPAEKPVSNRINIIYTGRWYGRDMQDPLPLFKALQKADFKYNLAFYTAPDVHDELRGLAYQYGIDIELHGYIPNSDIPNLLNKANVALVLTSPSNKGVLTTKFFEALGTATPVLCVPSDRGELASLIHSTHAGLASSDPDEILQFLRHPHAEIENSEKYSRQYQTERLCSLF